MDSEKSRRDGCSESTKKMYKRYSIENSRMNLWRFDSYTLFSAAFLCLVAFVVVPTKHTRTQTQKKVYKTILQRIAFFFAVHFVLLLLLLYEWLSKSFVNTGVTNTHTNKQIKRTIVFYRFCTLAKTIYTVDFQWWRISLYRSMIIIHTCVYITQQHYIISNDFDRCQACHCALCMRSFMQANKTEKGEKEKNAHCHHLINICFAFLADEMSGNLS